VLEVGSWNVTVKSIEHDSTTALSPTNYAKGSERSTKPSAFLTGGSVLVSIWMSLT